MRRMLLAVLVAVSLPAVAQSQNPAKPDSYLRLVAAAVSGYSAGGAVYVVICGAGNQYKVVGVYATAAMAQDAATAHKTNQAPCYVEGPYYNNAVAYPSTDMTSMTYGGGCKKGPDSDCIADSTKSAFTAPIGAIESVTITYKLREGGRQVSETFDPKTVEAVFFTMSAVDRMLIPYFVRVYGLNGALQKRTELLRRYGARDPNVNQTGPR
jgi:hypothetical protein